MKILSIKEELEKYKKQGYKVIKRRTTKLAKWALLRKEGEGWFDEYDTIYLYFVDGDVNIEHMNDFLKRYGTIYDEEEFNGKDLGILLYIGKLNSEYFKNLAKIS